MRTYVELLLILVFLWASLLTERMQEKQIIELTQRVSILEGK